MPVAPNELYIETQEAFMRVWRRVGLYRICPLTFDEPKEASTIPPYAKAMVMEGSYWRYVGGFTIRMKVDVEFRIPSGSSIREEIEQKKSRMNIVGKQVARVVDFRPVEAKVDRDSSARFAGSSVDLIPAAWELWTNVVTSSEVR